MQHLLNKFLRNLHVKIKIENVTAEALEWANKLEKPAIVTQTEPEIIIEMEMTGDGVRFSMQDQIKSSKIYNEARKLYGGVKYD